jgi:hypothetical protein
MLYPVRVDDHRPLTIIVATAITISQDNQIVHYSWNNILGTIKKVIASVGDNFFSTRGKAMSWGSTIAGRANPAIPNI